MKIISKSTRIFLVMEREKSEADIFLVMALLITLLYPLASILIAFSPALQMDLGVLHTLMVLIRGLVEAMWIMWSVMFVTYWVCSLRENTR